MHDHDEPDDICAAAAEKVGAIVEMLQPGSMMTKFFLVATVIDQDGEPGLWTQSSHGSPPWENLGMLEFAKATEIKRIASRERD